MGKSSIYNRIHGGGSIKMRSQNIVKLMDEKKYFLLLVFANLIAQLGITYYVMEKTDNTKINIWPLFFAELIIIVVLILVPMPEYLKFFIFCFFSYIFGLMLSVLKKRYNQAMINMALKGALTVFAFMMAAGVALIIGGINLGYQFGSILFWLLLLLIVARLVFSLGSNMNQSNKLLSFVGIILFAVYVVYDTNTILQRNYDGDFITASMDFYLDILNLFTNFLGSNN